ncbi:MAG: ABC transporter ATP-binding protein [Candidatus Schekmanbacteria bacterium]|nr:ABC transporter ATP-binding protein [Candidatus Schekmanbacteria bacterium]
MPIAATATSTARAVNLKVEGLCKRFGSFVAVDDLALEVYEGEIFGFLGPNGAGKTTSINMMCGLLRPDAGQTLVYGRPSAGDDPEVRARVGMCPQNVVLWPRLTCIEQLEFVGQAYGVPRKTARRRAEALLEVIGLADKRRWLARTLSGGMQRRLSIAMALVHEPDIVVLDEPEAGLDPQSRVLVREHIVALARQQKKTVIVTTHNMDEAERVADRVAIIDHGRLLELDTPAGLKRRVGQGDTLELVVSAANRSLTTSERERLAQAYPAAHVTADHIVLNERAIVDRLPEILDGVKQLGFGVASVQLRASTLEDVFLSLTGRSLRE